jgi:hypothetical protein
MKKWALGAGLMAAVVAASFSIQAQTSQFPTGKWAGGWTAPTGTVEIIQARLTIESIKPTEAKLIATGKSEWGDGPDWGVKAGSINFSKATVVGDTLTIGPGGTKPPVILEFVLQADGSLKGKRTEDGKLTSVITMKRTGN